MSAITTSTLPTLRRRTNEPRVSQAHVALSEWTKLRSLRSTRYPLFATLAMLAVIPMIVSATMSPADKRGLEPLAISLSGIWLAQLVIGALGVLIVSGEYSTGMIRSTFTAVPKRLPVLWAKAGVFGIVTLALTVPVMLIGFFSTQAILHGHRLNGHTVAVSFSDPGVARVVIGGALYLTLVGLFGVGLGAILRNTAAGISALAAVIFVLPTLTAVLPSSWNDGISPYLPSNAGQAIMSITASASTLSPWAGLALFATYTAAGLLVAAALLRNRDV
jgi:hypothetical protein